MFFVLLGLFKLSPLTQGIFFQPHQFCPDRQKRLFFGFHTLKLILIISDQTGIMLNYQLHIFKVLKELTCILR